MVLEEARGWHCSRLLTWCQSFLWSVVPWWEEKVEEVWLPAMGDGVEAWRRPDLAGWGVSSFLVSCEGGGWVSQYEAVSEGEASIEGSDMCGRKESSSELWRYMMNIEEEIVENRQRLCLCVWNRENYYYSLCNKYRGKKEEWKGIRNTARSWKERGRKMGSYDLSEEENDDYSEELLCEGYVVLREWPIMWPD